MFRLLWSVAVLSLVVGNQLLFASGALSVGLGGQVVCPNKQFTCPDGNTCCQQATAGSYGCCPLPQAVCCPDHEHCCPSGSSCDAPTGSCIQSNGKSVPWSKKTASVPWAGLNKVKCPDGGTCPDNNTCCQQVSGRYACCNYSDAVCCPDKQHCCPSSTTCGSTGQCNLNGQLFPALSNRQATPQPKPAGKTPPVTKQQVKKPLVQARQKPPVNRVVCPDKKSSCTSGSTCCSLTTGQWACCPLPQAMCCSDHLHCCPVNSTCDVAQKRCNRKVGVPLPWFSKLPARPVFGGDVVCPGGKFSCPSGSSCCKLSTGIWGCCPLPNAVCCSDGRHCCPKNYKCDVKQGTCIKEDNSISIFWQEIADLRGKPAFEIATICPGNKFKCGKSHKCCAQVTPEGEDRKFECCPFPGGTCCNDNHHCCPKGYQCDLKHLKCIKEGVVSIPIGVNKESFPTDPNYKPKLKRRKTVMARIKDVFGKLGQALKNHLLENEDDPDDPSKSIGQIKTEAKEKTMEKTKAAAKAKQKTAAAKGQNLPKAAMSKAASKLPAKAKVAKVSAKSKVTGKVPNNPQSKPGKTATLPRKTVPSSKSQGQTAKAKVLPGKASAKMTIAAKSKLKVAAGKLGTQQRAIVPKTIATAKVKAKSKAKVVTSKAKVVLPKTKVSLNPSKVAKTASHSQHRPAQKVVSKPVLPKGFKISKQNPVPKAKHSITPRASVVPKQKVSPKSKVLLKPKPKQPLPKYKDPGGAKHPPLKAKVSSKLGKQNNPPKMKPVPKAKAKQGIVPKYKPIPKAKAKVGFQIKTKKVPTPKKSVMPKVPKAQVKPKQVISKIKSPVKSKTTTFQKVKTTAKGKVVPKMVPKSYSSKNKAVLKSVPAKQKIPKGTPVKIPKKLMADKNIKITKTALNQGKMKAPGKMKVVSKVKTSNSIKQHPGGRRLLAHLPQPPMQVDISSDDKGDLALSKLPNSQDNYHTPAPPKRQPLATLEHGVKCPDGYTCADETTCCLMPSGGYACCPWPNAVCCADHIHCCASGQTCDESTSQCKNSDNTRVPWSKKVPTTHSRIFNTIEGPDVICPDQTSTCPDGSTCCSLQSGEYGCCPLPNAVCCSDHIHCCPNGYTCDSKESKCIQGHDSVPMYVKLPSHPPPASLEGRSVVCPDQTSTCPDGSTCCQLSTGQYGCCPLPQAVCCSDHLHCCPHGYTCDATQSKCNQGDHSIPMYAKLPSHPIPHSPLEGKSVVCPDQTSTCPDGSTCCKMSSGQYGCCPLPQAVCCSDHLHCCPHGYTCDTTKSKCNQGDHSIPMYAKQPSHPLPPTPFEGKSVVCPDQTSTCPDGSTCCTLSSGQYGCCPLPQAVCCSDHLHCCPHGYSCDTTQSKCNLGDHSIPMYAKQLSHPLPPAPFKGKSVVCPDQTSTCPDGSTCCTLSSGQYGCCPLPEAVCCSDHLHCCPHGYTCDATQSKCNQGDHSIPMYAKLPSHPIPHSPLEGKSVVCPDQTSTCPDGSTCCKMSSGQYGCCPLPQAVCCSDHLHCCPHGYTCDTTKSKCNQGDHSIPMYSKQPSHPLPPTPFEGKSVVCPDQTSTCPDGSTCCTLSSGQYGCCPLPQAVCCSDHLHCCPHGYSCDTTQSKCNLGDHSIPMYAKQLSHPLPPAPFKGKSVVCPDQTSTCPDGSTCCTLSSGQYGCCPLPEAVCCSDHLHCCPHGYTCDATQSKCNQGDHSIPMYAKLPSHPIPHSPLEGKSVVCPDQTSTCLDGSTCCKMSSGQYGCCPLPQAVCCSDHLHCCPHGYTCDTTQSKCNQGDHSIPMYAKQPSHPLPPNPIEGKSVVCPDQTSTCPDGSTCCTLSSGQYGCCPLPQAVCCSDHLHCCPHGYTCDATQSKCNQGDHSIPMYVKLPSHPLPHTALDGRSVVCPGPTSTCPDGSTCCQLSSGQYGCCPLPKAVCCSDHLHCCPHGYTCDVTQSKCNQGDHSIPMYAKLPSHPIPHSPLEGKSVVCPDQTSTCLDGSTCCKMSSGQYGCCPLPQAVCCSDHLHCCPHGYTCDTTQSKCNQGDHSIPMYDKQPSHPLPRTPLEGKSVVCPDQTSTCPDGSTCCTLSSGQYGCCPLPQAVCCSDHLHCCPHGYTCDATQSKCNQGDHSIPMYVKLPSHPLPHTALDGRSVVCPGQTSTCPDGSTCCQLSSGQYGCCPLPKAVCCSDHLHCCPHGYTCDVIQSKCNQGDHSIPMYAKLPSHPILHSPPEDKSVVCPDQTSTCPDGSTCCKMSSGQFGCCPLPQAVCCSDHLHCCPHGYTCDSTQSKCNQGDHSIPMYAKQPSHPLPPTSLEGQSVVCPDQTSTCPDGSTCCILSSGQYGCCPLPKAVCCSDHLHCCPHDYTCDVTQLKCNQGDRSIPMYAKLPSHTLHPALFEGKSVVCPDQTSTCPDGSTCCQMSSGQYGCCPLPQAVCCSDHVHCCPHDYTCNVAESKCDQGEHSIPLFVKFPSHHKTSPVVDQGGVTLLHSRHVGGIVCPDRRSMCPDHSTCCLMPDGRFGCCPIVQATCCQDQRHCCPQGFDCHPGRCTKEGQSIPWLKKMPASPLPPGTVGVVKCADGQECPDGSTCCKLTTGKYGCCPVPRTLNREMWCKAPQENATMQAFCCPDMLHCCPEGYVCDKTQKTGCHKKAETVALQELGESTSLQFENDVVQCPDHKSTCPAGSTCCMMKNKEYGCCPLSEAVCCSDNKHCCPKDSRCDPQSQQCIQKDQVIPWVTKLPAQRGGDQSNHIICPDGESMCPNSSTCCDAGGGVWACCPLIKATCCSDKKHCCPSGYSCNSKTEKCTKHTTGGTTVHASQLQGAARSGNTLL